MAENNEAAGQPEPEEKKPVVETQAAPSVKITSKSWWQSLKNVSMRDAVVFVLGAGTVVLAAGIVGLVRK